MDPYIGEIRLFAGNYAPADWMFCWGQTLNAMAYQALYSILGNMYGGTAPNTFQLPDLRGCALIHQGTGPGLTPRMISTTGGASSVTVAYDEIANHTHAANGTIGTASTNSTDPTGAIWNGGVGGGRGTPLYAAAPGNTVMNPQAIGVVGGGNPHNNMQPYVAINYIISLSGIYPVKAS